MSAAKNAKVIISLSVLMSIIFFCNITDAAYDFPEADKAYEEYWSDNDHESYPWSDYKVPFCKLERPRSYKYKEYDEEKSISLELVSYINFQCPVDTIMCGYTTHGSNDVYWMRFAACPNGKYYYLVSTYVGQGKYAIRSEVAKPLESVEEMYEDDYNRTGTTIKWESQRQNKFCEDELPSNAEDNDPAFLEDKTVVLPSRGYTEIEVECLVCIYNLKGDEGVQRVHYSHAPDGSFYEMRMYDFKTEYYNSEPFFIYAEA